MNITFLLLAAGVNEDGSRCERGPFAYLQASGPAPSAADSQTILGFVNFEKYFRFWIIDSMVDPMERKSEALGPTGVRVAERLATLRRGQGLTQGQLADRLSALGRPIAVAALSKIEKGFRRVDTDDLIALALALDVTPNELLLPDPAGDETVELTPGKSMDMVDAWRWATHNPVVVERGVFISYTSSDAAWGEWMAYELERAGIPALLAAWDFHPGMHLDTEIENAIRDAECVIAIVSRNYLTSQWAQKEWTIAARRSGRGRNRLLPVCVEKPVKEFSMKHPLTDIAFLDLASVSEDRARELLLDAVLRFGVRRRAGRPATPVFPQEVR